MRAESRLTGIGMAKLCLLKGVWCLKLGASGPSEDELISVNSLLERPLFNVAASHDTA